jgi:hypothetical protein
MASLAVVPVLVSAQSYTVTNSVRLPAESFVGDPIELRYRIRTDASVTEPEEVPTPPWGSIESLVVTETENEIDVRIVVIPFEPGTLTIPSLDLGELRLEGLSFVVSSVLASETNEDLRSIYGPERLPGTRAAVIVAGGLVVVGLILAFYFAGPGKKRLRFWIGRMKARLPYRRLVRQLTGLEAEGSEVSSREFYIRLVDAIQDYMSAVLRVECRSATTTELVGYLPILAAYSDVAEAEVKPLAEVFRTADRAKFAHASVDERERLRHVHACSELFADLETNRRRLRAPSRRTRRAHVGR